MRSKERHKESKNREEGRKEGRKEGEYLLLFCSVCCLPVSRLKEKY
jgi:predicted transposase YdaD